MNSCVFLAARKKSLTSHLLRLRLCLRSGKVIPVVFKFWKTWPGQRWWWGVKEKKPLCILILGMSSLHVTFFNYLWEIKLSSNSTLFPQYFWRVEIKSEKNFSYRPFLHTPPSKVSLCIGHFCVLVDWRKTRTSKLFKRGYLLGYHAAFIFHWVYRTSWAVPVIFNVAKPLQKCKFFLQCSTISNTPI